MALARLTLLALAALAGANADAGIPEPSDSKVHVVNAMTFNKFVKRHPIVLMEFYAPWCGHCQQLAPVYRDAAKMVSEADLPYPVVMAKFNDADEYNRQMNAGGETMFNFTSYPTLILFKDKKIPVANKEHWKLKYKKKRYQFYGGGRDKPDEFVFYLSAVANGLDPFDEERKIKPGFYKKGGKHESKAIVDLEPDGDLGFNTTVLEDPTNRVWVVEFYSDRCPFCNSLAPEIISASGTLERELGGKVKIGAINSRVYDEVATQHEVTSWPWVAAFYQGKKLEDMRGLGGADSIVRFGNEMFTNYWRSKPPRNKFLEDSPWSSKNKAPESEGCSTEGPGEDGQCGADAPSAEDKEAQKAELEALIAEGEAFNIYHKRLVFKTWEAISKGKSSFADEIKNAKELLKPLHDLKARCPPPADAA